MNSRRLVLFGLTTMAALTVGVRSAQALNLTVYPDYAGHGPSNALSVAGDYPAGWGSGSHLSSGTTKEWYYFTPEQLFGYEVTVGDVASMSWWTKTDSGHVTQPGDWYQLIYTKTTGQTGGWYDHRIHAEPYFSANLNDPANQWNLWNSDSGDNQLRFYDGTSGYLGSYTDAHWDAFLSGNSDIAGEEILYFNLSTANEWAGGLYSQLDGYTIILNNGDTATVNFETASVPDGGASLAMLGVAAVALLGIRRRKS